MVNVGLEITALELFKAPILLLDLLCLLLNSILIHVLRKLKKLETISFKFVLVLSISDICIAVTSICAFLFQKLFPRHFEFAAVISMYTLVYLFCFFSFGMISVISIDRYIHMRHLTEYSTFMTNRRGIIMVATTAFLSACFDVLIICGRVFGFALEVQLVINLTVACWIVIVFILYIMAFKAIKSRTDQMKLDDGLSQFTIQRRNASREFSRAVLVILCALVICYTPYLIFSIKRYRFPKDEDKLNMFLEYVAFCFVSANSSFNAIIMLTFNKDMNNFVFQAFKCR